jgi:hypothetical protein
MDKCPGCEGDLDEDGECPNTECIESPLFDSEDDDDEENENSDE